MSAPEVRVSFAYCKDDIENGNEEAPYWKMGVWIHILEKAGSTEAAEIQKAANRIHIPGDQLIVPWNGVRFAEEGSEKGQNVLGSGLIGQYQIDTDGNLVMEIIYPFKLATAKMIYPFKGF